MRRLAHAVRMPNARTFRLSTLALTCLLTAGPVLAADKPLLEAGSETPPDAREVRPPKGLLRFVLGTLDKSEFEQMDECLAQNDFRRGDYGVLLRAIKVSAGTGRSLWFVRGAREPFCFAFYGAHAFRYFWVEERLSGSRSRYALRYQNSGDGFSVYRRHSHGLNDIELQGCIAGGCRTARMAFDGRKYRPVRCSVTIFTGKGEVTRPRRCRSDGWSDGQASGFQPEFQ